MASNISQPRFKSQSGGLESLDNLPDSTSPSLQLSHPTENETTRICNQTSNDWRDALTDSQYLEESAYLLTVPLARNSGITQWILVDQSQPADKRTVLASCETFLKRALIRDAYGESEEVIAHGIASVYCESRLRKRGYASRLLKELSKTLPTWRADTGTKCVASILYSDIDPIFYQRLGWNPFPSYHLEFEANAVATPSATPLYVEDLAVLCEKDAGRLRSSISKGSTVGKTRFAIIPDHDHIAWHHSKEEFGGQKLFGKTPLVKGAIAGTPGNRVWAVWVHRFYRHPERDSSANILYILRFVMEGDAPTAKDVRAVLQAAQTEAAEWGLANIKLWSPPKALEELIEAAEVSFRGRTRMQESIPCLQWYEQGDGLPSSLDWVLNEKYAWC
ncbi:hypothetical protein BJY01DRAFT_206756 [Aspergillus pseudoustus]|uniref:LYC1 C-terminal domain-containing protein n=1 Tax=Aspergillus pseudoustus TaxID=1810923 RepID=A0ABR4KMH5_9EURO